MEHSNACATRPFQRKGRVLSHLWTSTGSPALGGVTPRVVSFFGGQASAANSKKEPASATPALRIVMGFQAFKELLFNVFGGGP